MISTIVLVVLLAWGLFALGYSLGVLWTGNNSVPFWERGRSRGLWRRNVVLSCGLLLISGFGFLLDFF